MCSYLTCSPNAVFEGGRLVRGEDELNELDENAIEAASS